VNELLKTLTNAKGTQAQRTVMIAMLAWLTMKAGHVEKAVEDTNRRVSVIELRLSHNAANPPTNSSAGIIGPGWPAAVALRYQGEP
jgi:hypothetical protein